MVGGESAAVVQFTRGSQQALYEQLAAELRALARSLPEGAPVPSELTLMQRHRVSRTTVRRALKSLVDKGLLVRRQGKGTFVAPRSVEHPLVDLGGFVEAFTEHGLRVDSELTSFRWESDISELPAGAAEPELGALAFRRVYRVEGTVWAMADCYVFEPYGSALSRADLQQRPSFEILQEQHRSVIAHSRLTVSSRVAEPAIAAVLEIPEGVPLLVLRRSLTAADGAVVQHAVHHLPADRFEFSVSEQVDGASPRTHEFPTPGPRLRVAHPRP